MSKTSARRLKRLFDIVTAAAALLVLFPLLVVVALIVRFGSPGPVFFRQKRTGLRGQEFMVIKFRTMTPDTRPVVGQETQPDDPHITRAGHWLRRCGIDELPQLWNVLAGQMSMVGPRPLLQWENDLCDPVQATRLNVQPGVTGLSQIRGRNNIPWGQRVAWDVEYVNRLNFWLDLYICLKTVPVVLLGQNAYLIPEVSGHAESSDVDSPAWQDPAVDATTVEAR